MKELNPYLPGGSHRVAKDTLIPDPDLKGFGLRIKPSGAMAWKVYARIRGTTVQLNKTIGTYPEMPPHEAQKIGRKHVMKAQDGKDPFDEPLPATPPPPSKMTVAQLAELYLTNWCAGANRASTLEENARIVATYITPRLGAKLARELLPADVRVFVRGFGKHRVQANRARAVLLRMYSWACDPAEHGDQALLTTNPVAIVKPFPEPPRPRPWTLEQPGLRPIERVSLRSRARPLAGGAEEHPVDLGVDDHGRRALRRARQGAVGAPEVRDVRGPLRKAARLG